MIPTMVATYLALEPGGTVLAQPPASPAVKCVNSYICPLCKLVLQKTNGWRNASVQSSKADTPPFPQRGAADA
ncbi:hypothetical protein EVAR_50724_1 [Eumeta japonica]|uniref:Uncharacterized protein n=1 Tax=Eumeta variegata TaxID=151549 RepID=A0A4C1YQK4_EUMVA|nr:hypothetical protein EVAR_50724_1 [Eumeta japonica]